MIPVRLAHHILPRTPRPFRKLVNNLRPIGTMPRVDAITSAEFPTTVRRPGNSVLDCSKLAHAYGITMRRWPDALAEMLETALAQAA